MNAKWPNLNLSIMDLARFLNEGINPIQDKKAKKVEVWKKPQNGYLKFNTYGSSRGCLGESGIGGILRNERGTTLALFSKLIGILDSTRAELLAMREAALVFATSRWNASHSLLFKCDLSNVVKWIKIPMDVPWRVRSLVIQITNLLDRIGRWEIKHNIN
ncbi:Uncharacterized protein TCM_038524 [Theobroma cacao]|uniref:RNase H type-1 domain-containing protein n=1 Tax=Theobroma cacao TaxID=3641 RepID=A0A061GR02_THECC|nr:Uncharacterized protein TCM_038524 [Theobroma cacao]